MGPKLPTATRTYESYLPSIIKALTYSYVHISFQVRPSQPRNVLDRLAKRHQRARAQTVRIEVHTYNTGYYHYFCRVHTGVL